MVRLRPIGLVVGVFVGYQSGKMATRKEHKEIMRDIKKLEEKLDQRERSAKRQEELVQWGRNVKTDEELVQWGRAVEKHGELLMQGEREVGRAKD